MSRHGISKHHKVTQDSPWAGRRARSCFPSCVCRPLPSWPAGRAGQRISDSSHPACLRWGHQVIILIIMIWTGTHHPPGLTLWGTRSRLWARHSCEVCPQLGSLTWDETFNCFLVHFTWIADLNAMSRLPKGMMMAPEMMGAVSWQWRRWLRASWDRTSSTSAEMTRSLSPRCPEACDHLLMAETPAHAHRDWEHCHSGGVTCLGLQIFIQPNISWVVSWVGRIKHHVLHFRFVHKIKSLCLSNVVPHQRFTTLQ